MVGAITGGEGFGEFTRNGSLGYNWWPAALSLTPWPYLLSLSLH